MTKSLRRELTLTLLSLTLLTWLVSVLVSAYYAGQMMVGQIDRHLTYYSDMSQHSMDGIFSDLDTREYFRSRTLTLSRDTELRRVKSFRNAGSGNAVNLWFGQSHILVGEYAPRFPKPEREGFLTWQMEDGSLWRILYRYSPEFNVWRGVGVDMDTARQGGMTTFFLGVLPLFFILPLTLAILYYGIRRGLRPLDELAEQIAARKPQALEPFDMSGVPSELRSVVVSLNGLLDRLQRALNSERRFTANVAHELQTPLAAILAAIQVCQRSLAGVGHNDVQPMLERISHRASEASDTVKQLLTLARLDPDQEFARERVELESLIMEVMADVGGVAMDREIAVRFDNASQALVYGNTDWLKIMLRNLFVNAFKYTPSPGEVEVNLKQTAGYAILTIGNDCEPISEAELNRLTERFYHPSNGCNHGVGLGLSIVQRVVELHEATLVLRPQQGDRGFVVEICFPGVNMEPPSR